MKRKGNRRRKQSKDPFLNHKLVYQVCHYNISPLCHYVFQGLVEDAEALNSKGERKRRKGVSAAQAEFEETDSVSKLQVSTFSSLNF